MQIFLSQVDFFIFFLNFLMQNQLVLQRNQKTTTMKRIIIFLIAFLPLFGQVYAGEATLVITDYKVDNPEGGQGGAPRGPVTLPEVWQDGNVFTADASCYGLTLRLVQGGVTVFETVISAVDNGEVVVPTTITGNYELQIQDGYFIFYGAVSL